MNWRILFCFREFDIAVVTRTLINLLRLMVKMKLRIGRLDLSFVEHRLQSSRLNKILTIEILNLQEVLTVVNEICNEIDYEFLHNHSFVHLKVRIETGNQRVHLLHYRRIIGNFGFNSRHILRLCILDAKLD